MVRHVLLHECHKTRDGWYSGMEALIYFIVGIFILYSKNVLGLYTVKNEVCIPYQMV